MTTSSRSELTLKTLLLLEQSQSPAEVEDRTKSICQPLGYDHFLLFSASAQHEGVLSRIYWIEGGWFDDGSTVEPDVYFRHCPVTRHVLEEREPFFWTKTSHGGGERYRVVRRPRGLGLHGFQVPIYGPVGLEGAMSFAGAAVDSSHQTKVALTLVATFAFRTMRTLAEGRRESRRTFLSDREREVMAWTAAGRRQSEIADMLGISARTVENHLRNIRARLGVATTAQAVQMAIRLGQLER